MSERSCGEPLRKSEKDRITTEFAENTEKKKADRIEDLETIVALGFFLFSVSSVLSVVIQTPLPTIAEDLSRRPLWQKGWPNFNPILPGRSREETAYCPCAQSMVG